MDLLRKGFRDIARGFTSGVVLSKPAFIKHLSYSDQIDQDLKREQFYDYARKNGGFTAEEKLDQLKKQGLWSDQKERAIKDSAAMIEGMVAGKRANSKWPSMVKDYAKKIEAEEKVYAKLVAEKNQLMGMTCESYADRAITDYYIISNIFRDQQMTEPLIEPGSLGYMDQEEVRQIISDYNASMECCSDGNVKKIAMLPFFQNYFSLVGDNLRDFFGKPICDLTFFQVILLRNGVRCRNIYMSHDTSKWGKDILADPDLFFDYADSVERAKKDAADRGANDADAINVGMKKEDADVVGVRVDNSLAKQAAAAGGDIIGLLARRG